VDFTGVTRALEGAGIRLYADIGEVSAALDELRLRSGASPADVGETNSLA
jgi:hypothetical protein